jgi:NAD(P)H-flavin reductase
MHHSGGAWQALFIPTGKNGLWEPNSKRLLFLGAGNGIAPNRRRLRGQSVASRVETSLDARHSHAQHVELMPALTAAFAVGDLLN